MSAFPRAGLRVPKIGLGASAFSHASAEKSVRILHAAEERGLTFVDTADCYYDGESEAVVGSAVAGRRDHFIIATKCGHGKHAIGGQPPIHPDRRRV